MVLFLFLFLAFPVNIQTIGCVVHDIYWRNHIHGEIPCDAYQGAPGKYIGQFNNKGHDLIGTIYTDTGTAVGIDGGKIIADKDIRILCAPDHSRLYWDYVDVGKAQEQQLHNGVKGGYYTEHHQSFIGKVLHEGEWRIGMVLGYQYTDIRGIWIWEQAVKPVKFTQFFILKYNVTEVCGKQCSSYSTV